MSSDMIDRLDKILDSHEVEQEAEAEAAARWESEREAFTDGFATISTTLICPVMEEIGTRLRLRGHDYEVTPELHEQIGGGGEREAARVKLEFYPHGVRPSGFDWANEISISFLADLHKNIVRAHESRLSAGGYVAKWVGEYELSEITPELVQRHIIDVIDESLTLRFA